MAFLSSVVGHGGQRVVEGMEGLTVGGSSGSVRDGATGSTPHTSTSLQPRMHAAGLYQIVSVTQEDQDNMFVRFQELILVKIHSQGVLTSL